MPDRNQIIEAYRAHFPELKPLSDNDVFRVIAVNDPELAQSWAKSLEKPVTPQKYVGRDATPMEVASDQAAEVLKGMGSAVNPANIAGGLAGAAGAGWNMLTKSGPEKYGPAIDLVKTLASPLTTSLRGLGALVAPHSVQAPTEDAWKSAAQGAGSMLVGSELPNALAGAGQVVSPLVKALADRLPSKGLAGKKFETINAAMGKTPASLTGVDDAALNAMKLSGGRLGGRVIGTGSTAPKVLSDYIGQRSTSPVMDFETARQFQSKAGSLSAEEKMAINKTPMQGRITQLAKALAESNRADAVSAGMGDLYDSAMTQYRQAARLEATKAAIASALRTNIGKAAVGGTTAAAGYGIYKAATK